MSSPHPHLHQNLIQRLLRRSGLRFPGLFAVFAALTALDLVVPDVVPLVDELGLAVLTALFWSWRDRRVDIRGVASR
jgi:hypothetical protein